MRQLVGYTLMMAVVVLVAGCSEPPKPRQMPPAAVEVLTVHQAPLTRSTKFVSRTTAISDVQVKSQVTAALKSQHFTTGQDVAVGDLLYTLDDAPFKNQVAQKSAAFARAESGLATAQRNYDRGAKLMPDGNISQSDMDTLEDNLTSAKATLLEAQAALDDANLKLGYTQITASIDGRMGLSAPSTGDVINANSEVLTNIVSLDPMRVKFQIDEKQLANRVHTEITGSAVEQINRIYRFQLVMPNGETYDQEGSLIYFDNRVSASTGTISMRADFPNPSDQLLPGQYVTLVVEQRNPEQVLMVPQAAVQQGQGGYSVLVVDDKSMARIKQVQLGDRFEASWEVVSGLASGERVIVNGIQKVRVGAPVVATEQQHKPFDEKGQAVAPAAEKEQ